MDYIHNCFWLLAPILIFNLLFAHMLPPAYQASAFSKDIPQLIALPENALRAVVMLMPLLMRLQVSTSSQRIGFGLYVVGVLVYFASWGILIVAPRCKWSASTPGFMAPAYTPAIWLLGIGLIGDELVLPGVAFKPWIYWLACALFLLFHNLHAGLVHARRI
jgi:hypothetical protein